MRPILRLFLAVVPASPLREAPRGSSPRAAFARSCRRIGATLATLALFGAANARAQNEAGPNVDLDADIAGWSFIGAGTWDGNDDFDGCTGSGGSSGSVDVSSEPPSQPGDPSISAAYPLQCVAVLPGETIYTEIAYRSSVDADVVGIYYDTANCTGAQTQEPIAGNFSASATWTLVAETLTAPPGALSLLVAWAAADANGLPFTTSWDRAYVGRRARVFSDDFEAASTCRWSAVSGLLE